MFRGLTAKEINSVNVELKISYCTIGTYKINIMFPNLFVTQFETCNFAVQYKTNSLCFQEL